MEFYYKTLKRKFINDADTIFIEQSQFEIFIYIEIDHNSSSPHVALDYQSQKEFEKIITNYPNFITAFA
ncbi:hypothetical protein [Streptococcus agalactiae]|uniref:hypothetical protein n=1 Tax=Streptococcus agalactiae TaxID=1311 RepID=UPI0005E76DA4|nr:hypothetical protein [Streptococcus agalactiae]CNI28950.1 transposase [Streptococcus agalactiae]